MTTRSPHRLAAVGCVLLAAVVLAGCGSGPTVTKRPGPGLEPTPATVAPTPAGTPSGSGCPPYPESSGAWPSDRLTGLGTGAGVGGVDVLEFVFGPPSRPGASAIVTTRETRPPFSMGGSGEPVDVDGSTFYEFRFEGMLLADELGNPTYTGSRDLLTDLSGIRHVVVVDAFEGVMAFVIGTTGGCSSFETVPAAGAIRFYAGDPAP